VRTIDSCGPDRLSDIKVTRVEFPDEESAISSGISFVLGMKHRIPVYTAYLSDRENQRICMIYALFVYVHGAFRAIDRGFEEVANQQRPRCGLMDPHPYRYLLDGHSLQARLIRPAPPVGRPRPETSDVSENVFLLLRVACDGSVLEADYVSGPPRLYKIASDAVKKWQYAQSTMNGVPAEMSSVIPVVVGPGNRVTSPW
jgi:hypothetical protein